ncbi:hypothetical protein QNI19_18845 [Cytophagaceae bacterium DM2B3-1]|uniref:Uncharacterized protein n=1 Tax=Xanthocytophaga flava TaxID=3048013 RepID=A0ABT7CMM8_9BACT|nr:hypothetical protein [Xanthocytophaga flavus]MDJ1473387.1 hypothetical protein [Xanthocytophaga flavus]MDJ1495004.1 hypothetical protein [Xanthocytophaga flavus]
MKSNNSQLSGQNMGAAATDTHLSGSFNGNGGGRQTGGGRKANPVPGSSNRGEQLVIVHLEQLCFWAADQKKYNTIITRLYEAIDNSEATVILSLKDWTSISQEMNTCIQKYVVINEKDTLCNSIDISKWENLMSNFKELYFHLDAFLETNNSSVAPPVAMPVDDGSDTLTFKKVWREFSSRLRTSSADNTITGEHVLREELDGNGLFLRTLEKEVKECSGNLSVSVNSKKRGDLILKIQQLAHLHYAALWNSCTREEQYILYDLAQDGLANFKNVKIIRALLDKGLLKYNGAIRLMNKSFRNYILTCVKPKQEAIIDREIMAKGVWSEFKIVLIIVMSALFTFIFLTQRETYNQITTILATFTASVPLLLRFFGSINFDKTKGADS